MSHANPVPLRHRLEPRDPHELHRVATPLELFFDLIFVVAIRARPQAGTTRSPAATTATSSAS